MAGKLTNEELDLFFRYAEGSIAILFMLIAIRCAEQGRPGLEMGVVDPRANTLEKQVRWAKNSIINNEKRFTTKFGNPARGTTGLFTDEYLKFFADRWAPLNASNDPQGLNKNWLKNARFFYARCRIVLSEVA